MSKYKTGMAVIVVALAGIAVGGTALGAECDGVRLPDAAQAGSAGLMLNGMGIRKATFLKVHVYVAGLYLPAKSGNADAILGADQAWHLALHFVRDVGASDIREAYQEGFAKAAGGGLAALQPRVDGMNAKMVDFKKGHELSFTHEPGKGTSMNVNGQRYPAIPGADFASALLKISIGPEPPNEELKAGLLGGRCG